MKVCNVCKIPKELEEFNKKTSSKDGHGNTCKICVKNYNDNYDYKKYHNENKLSIKEKYSKRYQNNKEVYLERSKKYFNNNIEEHHKRTKKWYNENKEYHQSKTKLYIKQRLKTDPSFKLKESFRKKLYSLLIKNKTPKIYSASKLLGCSIEECKQHLEQQFRIEMNWSNHGKVWEIDHIKPCSKFDLTNVEEQKQCFHYSNLQPLFKTTEIAESFGYNEIGNRNKYNN